MGLEGLALGMLLGAARGEGEAVGPDGVGSFFGVGGKGVALETASEGDSEKTPAPNSRGMSSLRRPRGSMPTCSQTALICASLRRSRSKAGSARRQRERALRILSLLRRSAESSTNSSSSSLSSSRPNCSSMACLSFIALPAD